jgi:hypothetical protein
MPATVTLEENGRVLHFTFSQPVSFAEITEVERQANIWYDEAKSTLHSLIDVRDLHGLPEGFFKLRNTKGLSHSNAGNTVILGASSYVQTIAETIFRLARNNRIRFFAAQKEIEAWEYLRKISSTKETSLHPNAETTL